MCALLTLCDTRPSSFSVALRDQFSISPSIAASDLPLNGSHVDAQSAELLTQKTRRRRERRGIVQNKALRAFVWVTPGPTARCVTSPNMPADLPRINDNHL